VYKIKTKSGQMVLKIMHPEWNGRGKTEAEVNALKHFAMLGIRTPEVLKYGTDASGYEYILMEFVEGPVVEKLWKEEVSIFTIFLFFCIDFFS
jgi:Ser/Thr protein kinase RdoA (MazF antagonist)